MFAGSHQVYRIDQTVFCAASSNKFQSDDSGDVVARFLYKEGSYWVWTKYMISPGVE